MLSGVICVILERAWVFFPVLSPGLIRLEFVTHKDDFKSYTLHMGSDIVYQATHSKVSFSLFSLVYGLEHWSGMEGRGGEGGLILVTLFSVSPFYYNHCLSCLLFLPRSPVSFSNSQFSFYWFRMNQPMIASSRLIQRMECVTFQESWSQDYKDWSYWAWVTGWAGYRPRAPMLPPFYLCARSCLTFFFCKTVWCPSPSTTIQFLSPSSLD